MLNLNAKQNTSSEGDVKRRTEVLDVHLTTDLLLRQVFCVVSAVEWWSNLIFFFKLYIIIIIYVFIVLCTELYIVKC